ncbi:hypothetical protein KR51_00006840 [Rubidibacter lacunae KORDI 51-2]|uniref:Uncharacterized protein n=1 Tax=Rubidibacter lacunae KORDI 51-2 TaxID=582515 RepID=U5DDM0_9CHRO|nr:hypothetical protein KR51_00006840 [Rubidibacter lacunae KORDI 51-2]
MGNCLSVDSSWLWRGSEQLGLKGGERRGLVWQMNVQSHPDKGNVAISGHVLGNWYMALCQSPLAVLRVIPNEK